MSVPKEILDAYVSPYIGEWIEMSYKFDGEGYELVSPYIGEWIEILYFRKE